MSEYGAHSPVAKSPISVGWVVLAALMCGFGLFLVWLFITTFDWIYFPGAALVILGAIMFLSERAGLDHA